jgi:RIO kinase 1
MTGKEAQVYLVVSGGQYAAAKIYKEAQNRTFKHRSEYTEGRKVRNTRDQRAMDKRSKHGRQQDEAAWRSTEVDMIHRLHAANVRVPVPYHFMEGVLIMELILDRDGNPAPRLGDVGLDAETAKAVYDRLVREVVKMLSAGVVHCDLSEFNVLLGADGPVIIDFPQSIDSAHNTNARKLLVRDVDNLHRFLSRAVPGARRFPYAEEMWSLYEQNLLTPETRLRGDWRPVERRTDTASVLGLIADANRDEDRRRGMRGPGGPTRGGQGPRSRDAGPEVHRARPGGPPPQRSQAPKKEPAVYQGLPNQGLKFFKNRNPGEPRREPQRSAPGPHPSPRRPERAPDTTNRRPSLDTRGPRNTQDTRNVQDTRSARDTRNVRVPRNAQDPREARDMKPAVAAQPRTPNAPERRRRVIRSGSTPDRSPTES